MAPHLGLRGQRLAFMRILLVVVAAFLLFGYNQSSLGGVLAFKSFTKYFPRIDTANTKGAQKTENSRIQGTVVAIYCLACLIGAMGSSVVGNRLGRRKTLVFAAGVATLGIIIQTSSYGLPQLTIGRIISGFGVGAINATVPVWQSESSKPKNRGRNVVVLGIFIATGIASASWINFGLSYIQTSSVSWRLPMAIPMIFTLSLMSFTYIFPESPRWLVMKGRLEEAKEVMAILSDIPVESEIIQLEIDSFRRAVHEDSNRERGWSDIFTMGSDKLFYRLVLAIVINFCAQMTGANVISYYANTIFTESLGLPAHRAALLSAGVLTWKIVAATTAFLTVDRVGRKPLFMISGLGMGTAMACLAGTVSDIKSNSASIAAIFFLFFYMAFFPLAFLGANFLLATEIAPQDLRVHYSAVGTATHWLFNFVIAEITPVAFDTIGYRYYIVYAVIGFSVAPMVYFLFPETKGRSLEEMGVMFADAAHWWQVPGVARKMKQSQIAELENYGKGDEKLDAEAVAEHVEKN